jgi:hypothetical protein
VARQHGGRRRYKAEEDRRRAAIHAAMRARQGRRPRTRTPAQFRALSERVRTPFNPGTGQFEPASKPPKPYPAKTQTKFRTRAERFFDWKTRKQRREKVRRLEEKAYEGAQTPRKPLRELPTQRELVKLVDEQLDREKKIRFGPQLTTSELRYYRQLMNPPRKSMHELLYGRKESTVPAGTESLYGGERRTAEDTARRLGYNLSKPVQLIGDRQIKGGVIEPRYDVERMAYPIGGRGASAHRMIFRERFAKETPAGVTERQGPTQTLGPAGRFIPHPSIPPSYVEKLPRIMPNEPLHLRGVVGTTQLLTPISEQQKGRTVQRVLSPSGSFHRDYSMEEWNKLIEARRKMGAFVVDEFGNRINRRFEAALPKHGGWSKGLGEDTEEMSWERRWREGRARGKDETDAQYEARRKELFRTLFPEPPQAVLRHTYDPKTNTWYGVTNQQAVQYLTAPKSLDVFERTRIRNAIKRHEDLRKIARRDAQRLTKALGKAQKKTRSARQRQEQLYRTLRSEAADIQAAKLKARKERRKKWRKSLSRLTSGIFGR